MSSGSSAGFKIRMGILLLLLLAAGGALTYDWFLLKPRTDKAFDKVDELLVARNDVDGDSQQYTPEYVQEQIGLKPVDSEEAKSQLIEYYRWNRMTPVEVSGGKNLFNFFPKYEFRVYYTKEKDKWIMCDAAKGANVEYEFDPPAPVQPSDFQGELQMPSVGGGGGGGPQGPTAPKPVDIDVFMNNDKDSDGIVKEEEIAGRDQRTHDWFKGADKDENKEVTQGEIEAYAAEVDEEIRKFEEEQAAKENGDGEDSDDAEDADEGEKGDADSADNSDEASSDGESSDKSKDSDDESEKGDN